MLPVQDHKGNTFNSVKDMCKHYGIKDDLYHARMAYGWTKEEALTRENTRISRQKRKTGAKEYEASEPAWDHNGNMFKSIASMCRHYGIKRATYYLRIKRGWTQKDALEKGIEYVYDHNGNRFQSIGEMCRHYGINRSTYTIRMSRGYSTEKALLAHDGTSKQITDPIGRIFPSISELKNFYDLPRLSQIGGNENKLNIEQKCHEGIRYRFAKEHVIGNLKIKKPLGFPYFLVETNRGMNVIMHIDEMLKTYHSSMMPLPKKCRTTKIQIEKQLEFPYYLVKKNKQEHEIMSYWDIINI